MLQDSQTPTLDTAEHAATDIPEPEPKFVMPNEVERRVLAEANRHAPSPRYQVALRLLIGKKLIHTMFHGVPKNCKQLYRVLARFQDNRLTLVPNAAVNPRHAHRQQTGESGLLVFLRARNKHYYEFIVKSAHKNLGFPDEEFKLLDQLYRLVCRNGVLQLEVLFVPKNLSPIIDERAGPEATSDEPDLGEQPIPEPTPEEQDDDEDDEDTDLSNALCSYEEDLHEVLLHMKQINRLLDNNRDLRHRAQLLVHKNRLRLTAEIMQKVEMA